MSSLRSSGSQAALSLLWRREYFLEERVSGSRIYVNQVSPTIDKPSRLAQSFRTIRIADGIYGLRT